MSKLLGSLDQRHLEAAQGWLGLGNHLEANEELEQITPEYRAHPAVLQIRWQIYAQAKKWEGALHIASALAQRLARISQFQDEIRAVAAVNAEPVEDKITRSNGSGCSYPCPKPNSPQHFKAHSWLLLSEV
jgi:hypothetical protein